MDSVGLISVQSQNTMPAVMLAPHLLATTCVSTCCWAPCACFLGAAQRSGSDPWRWGMVPLQRTRAEGTVSVGKECKVRPAPLLCLILQNIIYIYMYTVCITLMETQQQLPQQLSRAGMGSMSEASPQTVSSHAEEGRCHREAATGCLTRPLSPPRCMRHPPLCSAWATSNVGTLATHKSPWPIEPQAIQDWSVLLSPLLEETYDIPATLTKRTYPPFVRLRGSQDSRHGRQLGEVTVLHKRRLANHHLQTRPIATSAA